MYLHNNTATFFFVFWRFNYDAWWRVGVISIDVIMIRWLIMKNTVPRYSGNKWLFLSLEPFQDGKTENICYVNGNIFGWVMTRQLFFLSYPFLYNNFLSLIHHHMQSVLMFDVVPVLKNIFLNKPYKLFFNPCTRF